MKLDLALLLLCLCGITACDNKKAELNQAYDELGACLDKVIAESPTPKNSDDMKKLFEKEKAYCIDKAERIDYRGGNSLAYIEKKNNALINQ
ncbi:MAG: hypothetical protein J6W29_00010 [Neisseriaceae bacterium]|nr:hypothetical protein [Neisseriaceae bacterium]